MPIDVSTTPATDCYLCGRSGEKTAHAVRDQIYQAPGTWDRRTCRRCDLHWIDPRPMESDIWKLYEKYHTHGSYSARSARGLATLWAAIQQRIESKTFRPRRESVFRRAFEKLALFPAGPAVERIHGKTMWLQPEGHRRVLDVGCGSGELLQRLWRLGWTVQGVEPDGEAALAATRLGGISVRVGTLEEAGFADSSFDVVILNNVIEHLTDPIRTLREARRVLRPGGLLRISTPNARSWGAARFGSTWRGWETPRHVFVFSPSSLRSTMIQAGFSQIDVSTSSHGCVWVWLTSRMQQRDAAFDERRLEKVPMSEYARAILFWWWQWLAGRVAMVGEELVGSARA